MPKSDSNLRQAHYDIVRQLVGDLTYSIHGSRIAGARAIGVGKYRVTHFLNGQHRYYGDLAKFIKWFRLTHPLVGSADTWTQIVNHAKIIWPDEDWSELLKQTEPIVYDLQTAKCAICGVFEVIAWFNETKREYSFKCCSMCVRSKAKAQKEKIIKTVIKPSIKGGVDNES